MEKKDFLITDMEGMEGLLCRPRRLAMVRDRLSHPLDVEEVMDPEAAV
ncbi:MAG: hypothetical protein K6E63_00655 [Lachnospiraceae bacterium]|nr:hypothetical protein [Lachnospiraceae bacterium]